jgi:hypothetical protein
MTFSIWLWLITLVVIGVPLWLVIRLLKRQR